MILTELDRNKLLIPRASFGYVRVVFRTGPPRREMEEERRAKNMGRRWVLYEK